MSRRYPHQPAGITAGLVFGLAGLILGYAAGTLLSGISPLAASPITGAIAAITAYLVYSSESDRRPSSIWQGALADGIIAGITSGAVVGLLIVLVSEHAGASSGPSALSIVEGVGGGILTGLVAGGALGMLVLGLGGPGRITRAPARQPARRRKQSARKKRR